MKIVIFGHGNPVKLVIESLKKSEIKILNVEQDKKRTGTEQELFSKYLEENNIKINQFDTIGESNYDLILLINYNKIINTNDFYNKKIINIHMGLLPKYRGNNANAWAVLNGEKEVGYTIHEVNNVLDGGDIYYTFKYPVTENETYFNAKVSMEKDIEKKLAETLLGIFNNKLKKINQTGNKFIYCTSLKHTDGFINSWNMCTEDLFRKMYVFSNPLGTGLKFSFKGETYTINKISRIDNFDNSYGIVGAVVNIYNQSIWVKTQDTAISLDELICNQIVVDVKKTFKIGIRL